MSSTKVASPTTRKRGRGDTPLARKRSRAAFAAWDTRYTNEAAERRRRKRIARKAAAARQVNNG